MKWLMLCLLLVGCDVVIRPETILNGKISRPKIEKLDDSGVLYQGLTKGALVDTPSRQIIVTCTHTGSRKGSSVYFRDQNGEFTEIKLQKVFAVEFPVYDPIQYIFDKDYNKPEYDNFYNSDVTVGVLVEPAPTWAKAYPIAKSLKKGEWCYSTHQDFQLDTFIAMIKKDIALVERNSYTKLVIPGDSGLPWFNLNNELIATTTLTSDGTAACYAHPLMQKELLAIIQEAEKETK